MSLGLENLTIIDLTQGIAGPIATRLMADFGAEVLHVEPKPNGDWLRTCLSETMSASSPPCSYNYVWENCNRNKKSIVLDLNQELDREILHKLVKKADVFATTFRPREIEKFNLEYEFLTQLNPGIIYASFSGYGLKGSERNEPGYDSTGFWARAGILNTMAAGGIPPYPTCAVGDHTSGMCFAYGIVLALLIRERTGIGQKLETSLINSGVFAHGWEISGALATGKNPKPQARNSRTNPLVNSYKTKDSRWLYLCLLSPEVYWSRFCTVIDRSDLENDHRFNTLKKIRKNYQALFGILSEEVFPSKTLKEWRKCFINAKLPWAPLQTPNEVVNDPQLISNKAFVRFQHPKHGNIKEVANPIILNKTPAKIRMQAPEYGQNTDDILCELGYNYGKLRESE